MMFQNKDFFLTRSLKKALSLASLATLFKKKKYFYHVFQMRPSTYDFVRVYEGWE